MVIIFKKSKLYDQGTVLSSGVTFGVDFVMLCVVVVKQPNTTYRHRFCRSPYVTVPSISFALRTSANAARFDTHGGYSQPVQTYKQISRRQIILTTN